jgi:hypothetical protein
MADLYEPKYEHIDEIYLKEIVFEKDKDSTDVTIFGYYENPFEEELKRVDYCCPFSILTDLLLFADEKGDPIIGAIADKLNDDDCEYPSVIDVENLFGHPLKIDGIILTIYRPMEKNEDGEWEEINDDDLLYIIDSIESKQVFESKKDNTNNFQNKLAEHFIILQNAYKYYLQLLSMGISEKNSRKKAGLKDELLFRMAIINNEIINKEKK